MNSDCNDIVLDSVCASVYVSVHNRIYDSVSSIVRDSVWSNAYDSVDASLRDTINDKLSEYEF